MTLNIRFGLADDGANGWQHRRHLFPTLFQDYSTDFIACQEVNAFQVTDLAAMLKDYKYIGFRHPAPSFWQNNILFYRQDWQLKHASHFFLSPTPHMPSRFRASKWPRQCTMGSFHRGNHQITLINTHFDFDSSVQLSSARLIQDRLLQLPEIVPAVITGDFNGPIGSPHYHIFTNVTSDPENKGTPFYNAFQKNAIGTHHGFTGKPGEDCIDWILHTKGVHPLETKIIEDHVDGSYYSDHFPVMATFSF